MCVIKGLSVFSASFTFNVERMLLAITVWRKDNLIFFVGEHT